MVIVEVKETTREERDASLRKAPDSSKSGYIFSHIEHDDQARLLIVYNVIEDQLRSCLTRAAEQLSIPLVNNIL